MPKTFSEAERQAIRQQLQLHAGACLAAYGVRKTTVDEIVRRAKIPKGTFYLFYNTKEALLFEVILQWHDEIQTQFLQSIREKGRTITADQLTDAFCAAFRQIETTGLVRIMNSGEMEALLRKLPEALVAEHLSDDNDSMNKLIELLPAARDLNVAAFSAAFRGVFLMTLYQRELGDEFDNAIRLSLRGLSLQLLGGTEHD